MVGQIWVYAVWVGVVRLRGKWEIYIIYIYIKKYVLQVDAKILFFLFYNFYVHHKSCKNENTTTTFITD